MRFSRSHVRELLKSVVPRNSQLCGISFPDPAHTKSRFLEAAGEDIYVVKDSHAAVVTRSGVIRKGARNGSDLKEQFGTMRDTYAPPTHQRDSLGRIKHYTHKLEFSRVLTKLLVPPTNQNPPKVAMGHK